MACQANRLHAAKITRAFRSVNPTLDPGMARYLFQRPLTSRLGPRFGLGCPGESERPKAGNEEKHQTNQRPQTGFPVST